MPLFSAKRNIRAKFSQFDFEYEVDGDGAGWGGSKVA